MTLITLLKMNIITSNVITSFIIVGISLKWCEILKKMTRFFGGARVMFVFPFFLLANKI